ncbi:MAG: hypothetical protein F4203_02835 [Rhodobacteraceae bacterium]|nr:hypothetical protein [Paracoccaceae bacterium]
MARNAYPYLHRNRVANHPYPKKMETHLNIEDYIESINSLETDALMIEEGLELGSHLMATLFPPGLSRQETPRQVKMTP